MNALEKLLWSNVEKSDDGHWHWTGTKIKRGFGAGYGTFNLSAHRAVYLLVVGEIPPHRHLDHLCRVHDCVNPEHLEPVTNRVNILRGEGFGAKNARKTHCIRGHEFTEENTGHHKTGGRYCKTCKREAGLQWAREHSETTGVWGSGAYNKAKTHCRHGHEYTPENTYIWRGHRNCKQCMRREAEKYRAKQK